jgi:hypothetical protein
MINAEITITKSKILNLLNCFILNAFPLTTSLTIIANNIVISNIENSEDSIIGGMFITSLSQPNVESGGIDFFGKKHHRNKKAYMDISGLEIKPKNAIQPKARTKYSRRTRNNISSE